MHDKYEILSKSIKEAREKSGMTQKDVAEKANVDSRTVLNIENQHGEPKFEVLYSVIRALHIDPRDIFYPEMKRDTPSLNSLRMLLEDCTEDEAAQLIPVIQSVITLMRSSLEK